MRVTKNQDMHNEKGFVLVGSLVIISLIALVASITFTTTFTDIKISSNYKTSIQSFYIAEAGVQRAKAELKTVSFNEVLNGDYGGSPGILNFGTDMPFADGVYNVIVEDNEDEDPDNPELDSDGIVYIKGTGLKNGSKSSVELKIQRILIPFPPIPAAITIIGEAHVGISGSMDINVDGRDWYLDDVEDPNGPELAKYAIALSNIGEQGTQTAIVALDGQIAGDQASNFKGTTTEDYPTKSIGLDNDMTSQDLQDFVDMAKLVADNSLMASDVPDGLETIEFGSDEDPKITYINMKPEDNDSTAQVIFEGDITGSGILIVEGNDLLFNNSLNWTGLVIVIGDDVGGALLGDDSLEQAITGAFIVDEQDTDDYNELVLTGDVNVRYSSEAMDLAQKLVFDIGADNITMLTWRQILND